MNPDRQFSTASPMRCAGDKIACGESKDRFHRRTKVVSSPEIERMVNRAVARAKLGDRDAIRYLYLRFSDNVFSYVRSIVRDEHEAEDVTQHVFAKLLTAIHKYESRGVPFSGWILRLAHNVAIDHLRTKAPIPVEEVRSSETAAEQVGTDAARSLGAALGTLPDDQRTVLFLRHVVGLSPGEIAEQIGRSESSIHGLHHRGRRNLQVQLLSLDAGPVTLGAAA